MLRYLDPSLVFGILKMRSRYRHYNDYFGRTTSKDILDCVWDFEFGHKQRIGLHAWLLEKQKRAKDIHAVWKRAGKQTTHACAFTAGSSRLLKTHDSSRRTRYRNRGYSYLCVQGQHQHSLNTTLSNIDTLEQPRRDSWRSAKDISKLNDIRSIEGREKTGLKRQ
jgi:hypothetical protein